MSKILSVRIPDALNADLVAEAESRAMTVTAVVVNALLCRNGLPEPKKREPKGGFPNGEGITSGIVSVDTGLQRRQAFEGLMHIVGTLPSEALSFGPQRAAPGARLKGAKK